MKKAIDQKYKVKFSIRQKLFFLVLIGFSALIVATSWRIGIEARKEARIAIERSLAQSSVILETKLKSRLDSIDEVAKGLAKDGRVFPLVYEGEALTLQDLSLEFKRVLEFDILFFTDDEGTILARSDRPEAIGQSVAGRSALFDRALDGNDASGVISVQGTLLQIVVVPIFDNFAHDIVRGTVALAYELSPEMAQEILSLTASEIGFFIFTRNESREVDSVSSFYNTNDDLGPKLEAWFQSSKNHWQPIFDSIGPIPDHKIALGDEHFLSVVFPLRGANGDNLGFVLASQSQTELLKPFVRIQQQVILVGVICLFLASIFAWLLSKRISKPIIDLVKVANDIQEGQYPETKKILKQNDEVDILSNAIYHMGNSLKEKAELETYLAQLSEDLDETDEIVSSGAIMDDELAQASEFIDGDETMVTEPAPVDEDATIVKHHSKKAKVVSTATWDNERVHTGSVIANRYEITKLLGIGAMGEVFLAKDRDLDENIAIKILSKTDFAKEEFDQFKEEIRLARRITHRNILRTFDFGVFQKPYYITMEFVQGHDLGKFIEKKGPLEIGIGLAMAKQICTAMNAAHQQGIIHRDLKPANMMITRQGILKIMDFGLAMRVRKADDITATKSSGTTGDEKTTVAGTPKYMAPEQFFGWDLDERADIYSIGVILFTLFAGTPPFKANSFEEFAKLHYSATPPKLTRLVNGFPEKLELIINKALQKKPEDRFESVRQMLDYLQSV